MAIAISSLFSAIQELFETLFDSSRLENLKAVEAVIKNDRLNLDEEKQLKNLYLQYLSEGEYQYQKNQEKLFYQSLPQLIKNHSGMYIWFESGNVLASDPDEEILLDKIENSNYFQTKKSKAVYVRRIPKISKSV